jgi:uncharacterized protein YjiS (DUF1127 family)
MEPIMSTITMTTFRHLPRWQQLKSRVGEWQRRVRTRHELEGLSDATLRDIGIKRCRAQPGKNRLFWVA